MQDRATREKFAYNQGLQRTLYSKVFSHCNYYWALSREKNLTKIMHAANGGQVLELGTQAWRNFIYIVGIKPKSLTCINISESELNKGIDLANSLGVVIDMRIMDAHKLEFSNNSFDVVYGGGILHHLDFKIALSEIERVLNNKGIMVFVEPLDNNFIGRIARFITPKARTHDEVPLRHKHLLMIEKHFDCEYYYEQLFSVPIGIISGLFFSKPENLLNKFGFELDMWLIKKVPKIGLYYRNVLIVGKKNKA